MGLLSKIKSFISGKPERMTEFESHILAAVDTLNSILPGDKQRVLAPKTQTIAHNLLMKALKLNDLLSLQVYMMAMANSLGLFVWKEFGHLYPVEQCTKIANAVVTLELYANAMAVENNAPIREMFISGVVTGMPTKLASSIVVRASIGQVDRVEKIVEVGNSAIEEQDVRRAIQRIIDVQSQIDWTCSKVS